MGTLANDMPLRLDNSEERDAFRALTRSGDEQLWKWTSREPQMQQHPITGDTIFHLLCRTEALDVATKVAGLADLKLHYRNPLTETIATSCASHWPRSPS
jgi:hypothetical protein